MRLKSHDFINSFFFELHIFIPVVIKFGRDGIRMRRYLIEHIASEEIAVMSIESEEIASEEKASEKKRKKNTKR